MIRGSVLSHSPHGHLFLNPRKGGEAKVEIIMFIANIFCLSVEMIYAGTVLNNDV